MSHFCLVTQTYREDVGEVVIEIKEKMIAKLIIKVRSIGDSVERSIMRWLWLVISVDCHSRISFVKASEI